VKALLFIFILLISTLAFAEDYDTSVPAQGGVLNSTVNSFTENTGSNPSQAPSTGEITDEYLSQTGKIVNYPDKNFSPDSPAAPAPVQTKDSDNSGEVGH
jgi:hypothetical protein